jgi:hypothetical protein
MPLLSLPPTTVGATLERDRLESRAVRLQQVLDILAGIARRHRAEDGSVPPQLERSLLDFHDELARVRARLADA